MTALSREHPRSESSAPRRARAAPAATPAVWALQGLASVRDTLIGKTRKTHKTYVKLILKLIAKHIKLITLD